ncbi:MAG: beta-lactamase family protein [Proteobacteria bacterium]|nr:beta-lactamase family protein [Cystobacterineae bacterium]MCL2314989.1 beta-lactamase family protein [Pseudomonadota bacterium]
MEKPKPACAEGTPQTLLEEAAHARAFGAYRAEVWHRGKPHLSFGNVPPHTFFDLASLTKVLGTTALFFALWQEGKLHPSTPLHQLLPEAPRGIGLDDILFHRAGFAAHVPLFVQSFQKFPALAQPNCPGATRIQAREACLAQLLQTHPVDLPGTLCRYSDIGFMWLGHALQNFAQCPLEVLFENLVARPLGLKAHFRPLTQPKEEWLLSPPTGLLRPRPPAPGQEGLWTLPQFPSAPGSVDDDNAFALAGVAGHAGLFGRAVDVARFGQALLEGHWKIPYAEVWPADSRIAGSTRAMGFDRPSPEGASAGHFFGKGPKGAVGHLGFVGTSLWVDLDEEVVAVLLCNRTLWGRHNLQIRQVRPRFHNAIWHTLRL